MEEEDGVKQAPSLFSVEETQTESKSSSAATLVVTNPERKVPLILNHQFKNLNYSPNRILPAKLVRPNRPNLMIKTGPGPSSGIQYSRPILLNSKFSIRPPKSATSYGTQSKSFPVPAKQKISIVSRDASAVKEVLTKAMPLSSLAKIVSERVSANAIIDRNEDEEEKEKEEREEMEEKEIKEETSEVGSGDEAEGVVGGMKKGVKLLSVTSVNFSNKELKRLMSGDGFEEKAEETVESVKKDGSDSATCDEDKPTGADEDVIIIDLSDDKEVSKNEDKNLVREGDSKVDEGTNLDEEGASDNSVLNCSLEIVEESKNDDIPETDDKDEADVKTDDIKNDADDKTASIIIKETAPEKTSDKAINIIEIADNIEDVETSPKSIPVTSESPTSMEVSKITSNNLISNNTIICGNSAIIETSDNSVIVTKHSASSEELPVKKIKKPVPSINYDDDIIEIKEDDDSFIVSKTPATPSVAAPSVAPKKGGRRRKNPIITKPEDDFNSFEVLSEKIKQNMHLRVYKGRKSSSDEGRVEKSPKESVAMEIKKEQPVLSLDNEVDVISTKDVVKKEVKQECDEVKVEQVEVKENLEASSSVIVKSSKPGRPRKSKTPVEVEVKSPVVNTSPPGVKKRGRPRKQEFIKSEPDALEMLITTSPTRSFEERMDEEEDLLDNSSSEKSENQTTVIKNESSNQLSPAEPLVKKRRGRPRTKHLPKTETSVVKKTPDSNVPMDTSKSGRKRKKINYFNMENSFIDEDLVANVSSASAQNTDKRKRKKSESSDEDFVGPRLVPPRKYTKRAKQEEKKKGSEDDELGEPKGASTPVVMKRYTRKLKKSGDDVEIEKKEKLAKNDKSEVKEEKIKNESVKTEEIDVVVVVKEEKIEEDGTNEGSKEKSQVDELVSENKEKSVSKEKEKSVSDETKEVSKENSTEKNANKQKSATTTSKTDEKNVKNKYQYTGDTKKMMKSLFSAAFQTKEDSDDSDSAENESEELIICGVCKAKLDDEQWDFHNRTVHYNLAWRSGETFLNIDNEVHMKKVLRPILQEDKQLVCYKCKSPYADVLMYMAHRDECEGVVKDGKVVCAVCNEQLEKAKWAFHKKRKHNNLAWRVADPPIDLNNQSLVVNILNIQYKNKIPLYCYKCDISKKSVVGFLSHQAQCGIALQEIQVQCEFCHKKVLPVSLQAHIKLVHKTPKGKHKKVGAAKAAFTQLGKRKAAQDALDIINSMKKEKKDEEIFSKNVSINTVFKTDNSAVKLLQKELDANEILKCKFDDCDFETNSLDDILGHLEVCQRKPEQYFTCMFCLTVFNRDDDVKNHIVLQHDSYQPSDFNEVSSEEETQDVKEKVRATPVNARGKPKCIKHLCKAPKKLFQCAFEYTLEFCNEHFTQSVLYDELRVRQSDWALLETHFECYLPKTEVSCEVSRMCVKNFENVHEKEHSLKTYELFESDREDNVTTIFCGGPINAMAWLPTPYILLRCNQILAVAVGNDFDGKYLVKTNYDEKCVIQFWDFGVLKKKEPTSKPELYFCLTVDYGPVWHLEWCPSGCYDEKEPANENSYKRMGLLAVAGSKPDVRVYAIPFLKEDVKGLVYESKPLMRLCLTATSEMKMSCFPTKISWSKASKHKYIAVGYSNGLVAMFDLDTKSDCLKFKNDADEKILLPYKTIKAHTHYISVLQLIHLGGGNRWLLTGSFDWHVCVWDLTNDTKVAQNRKKMITDGVWLTNWVSYITTTDESNSKNLWINSCVSAHRDFLSEPTYIFSSPSTLSAVSFSDWLNGVIHGSSTGEIISLFPNQILFGFEYYRKSRANKYCLGYARLIDKHKTPEERVKEEAQKQKALQPIKTPKDMPDPNSVAALLGKSEDHYNKYEPIKYKETNQKYGLVFCDMKMNTYDDFSVALSKRLDTFNKDLEVSRPNLYPLQKINKICFNPNCQASLYFSVGYQAGFVRVFYMKFLENDRQVV